MRGRFSQCFVAAKRVRSDVVVIVSPEATLLRAPSNVSKYLFIQRLALRLPFEALNEPFCLQFCRIDFNTNHVVITRLFQDRATGELRLPLSQICYANRRQGNGCRW